MFLDDLSKFNNCSIFYCRESSSAFVQIFAAVDFVWHHHKGILTLERNPGGEESLEEQVSSGLTRKKVTLQICQICP